MLTLQWDIINDPALSAVTYQGESRSHDAAKLAHMTHLHAT